MRAALVVASLAVAAPAAAQETRDAVLDRVAGCILPQQACRTYDAEIASRQADDAATDLAGQVLSWSDAIVRDAGRGACEAAEGVVAGPVLETETRRFAVATLRTARGPRCYVTDLGAKG